MANPPIDMEHLNEVTDNDTEFQVELFQIFQETANNCVTCLQTSCANENNDEWRARAHELKGSAANLGANTLAEFCKQAIDAENASSEEKSTLLKHIEQAYRDVKEFFQKLH